MDINHESLSALTFQYKRSFEAGLKAAPPIDVSRIAETIPSGSERNLYAFLGDIKGFRRRVGERILQEVASSKYELSNADFEDGFKVKRNEIEDDLYGVYNKRSEFLGRAASFWPYEQVFEALAEGTERECYDGQPFFDDQHPVGMDGNVTLVSNDEGGSDVPAYYMLDTNGPIKPLIWQLRQAALFEPPIVEGSERAFFHAEYAYGARGRGEAGFAFWQYARRSRVAPTENHLRAMRLAMRQQKTPEGRRMGVNPNLIVCGAEVADTLEKILKRETIAEGSVGVSNVFKGAFEVMVVPILD